MALYMVITWAISTATGLPPEVTAWWPVAFVLGIWALWYGLTPKKERDFLRRFSKSTRGVGTPGYKRKNAPDRSDTSPQQRR